MEAIIGLVIGVALSSTSVWLIMRSQLQIVKCQKQDSVEKASLCCSQREKSSKENDRYRNGFFTIANS